jgi:aminoglycoside phosphotransferase (APT) family kinase protein
LTTLPSDKLVRGSFRIEFADGTVRKGRRLGSGADAERIEVLSGLLDPRYFPRTLARRDAALLIEWIDGEPFPLALPSPAVWTQCGEILGAMHTLAVPEELRARYDCDAAGWRARLRRNREELAGREALNERETHLALQVAEKLAPENTATGLIHGDFCIENFIETESGGIAIVDNETVNIDVYAYDLARTWSRSPTGQGQVHAFYKGYHRHRASSDFRENHLYWAIAVLTEAAVFRLRAETTGIAELMERLRIILEWGELRGRYTS